MNKEHMLKGLLPAAAEADCRTEVLPAAQLKSVTAAPELERFAADVCRIFDLFGQELKPVDSGGEISLALDAALPASGFAVEITTKHIRLTGGDAAGVLYGVGAMRQLAWLAFSRGPGFAAFDCGRVVDYPRFGWRGFMLDSARHFQSAEQIKAVLALMSEYRLNVFHWHLTDNQGWRFPSGQCPELSTLAELAPGGYTAAELRDIARFAKERFIEIVPEIDMPGHSGGILKLHPELACNSSNPGREYCLSKPEVKEFIRGRIDELLQLLPETRIVHLGGDEADTDHWDRCPLCRQAIQRAGLNDSRELESAFMREMAEFVLSRGKTPMVWFTDGAKLPEETIVQAWLSQQDMRKTPPPHRLVNSTHTSFYLDYPATTCEPYLDWMSFLSEEGVYAAVPEANLGESLLPDRLLGPECCLWTERIPAWRVIQKAAPRLSALAEIAWSCREKQGYADYLRRKHTLMAAGYPHFHSL